MTKPARVVLISAGSMILLLLIVAVAGYTIAQSGWFQNKVRERLVAEVEKATGGTAEIGSFHFDWKTLTAEVDGFVVHGTEPKPGPPLLSVDKLTIGLKIVSLMKRDVDIRLLRADTPKAFVLVRPDGTTNIPSPKLPQTSNKTGPETLLDLAIGRFEINNGTADVRAAGAAPKITPYSAKGENLKGVLTYDAAGPRYGGDISVSPLTMIYGKYLPVPVNAQVSLRFEKDRLQISKAHLTTARSTVDLDGTLDHFSAPVIEAQYRGRFDLAELGKALGMKGADSGTANSEGKLHFVSATDYKAAGTLQFAGVSLTQPGLNLRDVHGDTRFSADPKLIDLEAMRLYALGGEIRGSAQLRELDRYVVKGELSGFDAARLAQDFASAKIPYDGVISGPFESQGRLSQLAHNDYSVSAKLGISPAANHMPLRGLLDVRLDAQHGNVVMEPSFLQLPSTRLTFSGSLNRQLAVHVQSTDLSDLKPVAGANLPVSLDHGQITFDGTVNGNLSSPVVQGHFSGSNLVYSQQKIDVASADIVVQKSGAEIRNGTFGYQSLRGQLNASVTLNNWKLLDPNAIKADVSLQNADLSNLLAIAGQHGLAITGTVQASGHLTGSVGNPQAVADLTVTKGTMQGEPFDKLTIHLDAPNATTEKAQILLAAGTRQLHGTVTYGHAAGQFLPGTANFEFSSNAMQLAQFKTVHDNQPSLSAVVQFSASGSAKLLKPVKNQPGYLLQTITADVNAKNVNLEQRQVGDLTLTARTSLSPNGPVVNAHVQSDFAKADIRGDAQFVLSGDYPGSGSVAFSKVDLATLRSVVAAPSDTGTYALGGTIEGSLSFSGAALKQNSWNAKLEIPKLLVRPPNPSDPVLAQFTLSNSQPIRATLKSNKITIESAHLVSRDTDVSVSGTIALDSKTPLDLHVDGKADLSVLHVFERDIYSSGAVELKATVRGTYQSPNIGGFLDLKNANINLIDAPNGLSNAQGRVTFDGNRANLQNLTAETGGGKVKMTGFLAFAGKTITFRVQAEASAVRIRYPEGVSTVVDASLSLTGSRERSVLSGTITILRTAFNPRTDVGSILASSASPVKTVSVQTGILGGLQFDVGVQTSPDISFQTALTESLQAEANLRLRGTVSNPVLLGRINITQGDLTFFGNKYTINSGTISFYNPVKLEPILNVDLETRARGVDVTITVSGPIDKLNVSYHSDPPLQFSDIVALLATGRTPSDATVAARQPAAATQSWEQRGASALVGQAIANPVAGRLQRFFGVSKLKIDPLLSGITGNPQARLTIEQQVTPDVTFTYITDVANTSTQIVRVEWAINKNVSAVALREENGYFGLDIFYKKRFK
jgi:translocation and assembly module TamB